ncbi:MAG: hypothetical protein Kow006_22190 [Gammaproteobacteria bacterium]
MPVWSKNLSWRLRALPLILAALLQGGVAAAAPSQLSAPAARMSGGGTSGLAPMAMLAPVITGFKPDGCARRGGELTVVGNHFGKAAGKGAALGGHGVHVDAQILRWTDRAIVLRIPDDPRLRAGQWYYIGIEQVDHGRWLSNIDKTVTICTAASAVPSLPAGLQRPTPGMPTDPALTTQRGFAGSASRLATPSPPPGGTAPPGFAPPSDEQELGYPDEAPYLPQPSQGTLLNSPLPPAPEIPPMAPEAERIDAEPSELVVVHGSGKAARRFAGIVREMGLSIKRRRTLKGLGLVVTVLRLPPGARIGESLQRLRGSVPRLWADANHRFTLQGTGDPTKSYPQKLVGWPASKCAGSPRIGMVDTSVETGHPALRRAAIVQKSFLPAGVDQAPPRHGTAVAALLVASPDRSGEPAGLLPKADLQVAAVFRTQGEGRQDSTAELIAYGLDWLAARRVSVINLSFGGPRNLLLEAAVHRVQQAGIAVVAAAGNGGAEAAPVYPAAQEGVVAVTAVDADKRLYRRANRGAYIDISAPGVDVWSASAQGGGAYYSGTSYATPFVTAALAMRPPTVVPAASARWLSGRTIDLGPPGRDPGFGWGLLQAGRVCDLAGSGEGAGG